MKQLVKQISVGRVMLLAVLGLLFIQQTSAQEISSSIDTTQIKIGEQLHYQIQVKANKDLPVVFPEGQSFMPLEMVEVYRIDTTQLKDSPTWKLTREYVLTQWDSGSYTIPRQKVIINDQTFFTDSLKVEVATVVVDTTKQDVFPIKPTIEIKEPSVFPMWLLWVLLTIGVIAGLVFLILKLRKRKIERAKQIPPYERAIDTLKKLDESQVLERGEMKVYYSTLTLAVKRYIDEKIDERALESTTEELIVHLNELKANQSLLVDNKVINDLKDILRRADLIKFAGGGMDKLTAKADRKLIEEDINNIKDSIPEPTEEELQKDEAYLEGKKKKEKRTKIIAGVVGLVLVFIVANFVFFENKGFEYLKDLVIHDSAEELLEKDWIASEYGNPPVYIITPEVLVRKNNNSILAKDKATLTGELFTYGAIAKDLYINLNIFNTKPDSSLSIESQVDRLEALGAKNILSKEEKFTTADGSEGVKVFGDFSIKDPITKQEEKKSYVQLFFASEQGNNISIFISAEDKDEGFKEIINRIINSVEFNREN
ncbi:BatD family protein [Mesonia aestuariivivens]|uniref:BatD family protein n=1 Tax=Mesonia aestuariivivens TaxID=2796128 RepID=A0ABS6VYB1_9FLAO|nr:BatD family protein [Mesonia aestuariivivens]MBW2960251.1 BatD family protein [Mesonia aestuariivivens]